MSSKNVVVTLELGHRATVRQPRGGEIFTHDWEVFVQGASGTHIEAFIEKIVFTLHKSFAKPKRVLKNPPYKVCEKGYGSFNLPIEIYFKTNNPDDTRKTQFEYDLFLQHVECPPINHQRKEKLTFLKPSEDFKRKLLYGGGVIVMGQEDSSQGDKTAVSRPSSGAKIKPHAALQHQPDTAKKHKHQTIKETKKQESKVSDQFSALFGEPIKKIAEQKKPSKEKPPKEKEKVPEKLNEKYKDKTPLSKSSEKKPKDKHKSEKTSSSSSAANLASTNIPEVKEEKREKVKEKSHKEKHKRDRDKERDKHKKDRDRENKKQREKETSKRSSSPSSKRSLSPASKRSLSPASKRSLSPASKRSLSPASSIKSDSSAKRKKCEAESTKIVVEKTNEETKEKKKDKKKDKKEKRRDKEDTPSVEADREKPVDKVPVKTESSTKMAAPILKDERVVLPVKSGERSPAKERVKVEHKVKKGAHKEVIKEDPVTVTPQVIAKEKKVKEKPVLVPPPAPARSRSSSKSSSRSLSPSLSVSRSPSPACSRSSSKSSRSRSPPSPASVGRESPCRSRSLSHSRSPARSKSRSHSRSSSGSRRSVSRSPSVSRSKSRSPSRSPSHSRSPSRSQSKSRSRSRSASGSRSQSSSPARSKSRSVSRSPTRSVSSSSSGSSPSPMSVTESQSQAPAPRAGPPRPPLTTGPTNPLSIMMKEVSSSSSESEERGSADGKGQVKVPLRSPSDASRPSHAPVGQQASTATRQIKKEPIMSSDDEVTPVVKDNSRGTGKREHFPRRPPQRDKKKRRSQQDNNSPITTSLPSSSPKETVKSLKEEIKQEDIKGVKEEASATSRLTPEYLQELVELQHKIMNSVDRDQLQQVVDIIAEHSSFQLTHAHFNFDLCSLDAQVVKQLQGCFS